jgi:hypothetical protein
MGLLDTLIVISGSFTLALLLLWLMAQLRGVPLDITPPGYMLGAAKHFGSWLLGGAGSSLLLTALRRGLDRDSQPPQYLLSIVVVAVVFVALVLGGLRLIPKPEPIPRGPSTAATGAPRQAVPADTSTLRLTASVPTSFSVDYPFPDPHGTGMRNWRREGTEWVEHFPDGVESRSETVGRIAVQGDSGTLARTKDRQPPYEYFIPDKDSKLMWIRIRQPGGSWSFLNEMKGVS